MICCAVAEADVPLLLHHLLLLAVIVKNNRVEDELDEHDYEPVGTAGRVGKGIQIGTRQTALMVTISARRSSETDEVNNDIHVLIHSAHRAWHMVRWR